MTTPNPDPRLTDDFDPTQPETDQFAAKMAFERSFPIPLAHSAPDDDEIGSFLLNVDHMHRAERACPRNAGSLGLRFKTNVA